MTVNDAYINFSAYFGTVYVVLVLFSIAIVWFYAEPGFPYHSYITITIAYFCSFGILLLVPIDIAACVIDRRSSTDNAYQRYQDNVASLSLGYNIFFTLILILGRFVLVYEEYFNTDGYFTFLSKSISAFIRMLRDIFLMIIAALIVLSIIIGQKIVTGPSALLLSIVIVTNGVYEFILMFFLAYGLVEFPRHLWNRSNLDYSLLQLQMQATADYKQISDHKIQIQEEISKVKYFKDQIAKSSMSEDLKQAIIILEADCPSDFKSERKCKLEDIKKYLNKKGGQITVSGLASLRSDLNMSKDRYKMAQAKVLHTETLAYYYDDLVNSKNSSNATIFWSLQNKESTKSEYQWHIVYKPLLYKVASISSALLSFFSFLGVVCSMVGIPNEGSPYFLATHSSNATVAGIVVFILFTLGYTTYVVFWSLFQIRVPGLIEMVPYRTPPEYLSFNARNCLRFAAPIAFFYLGWIAENGIKTGSWVQLSITNTTYFNQTIYHPPNVSNQTITSVNGTYSFVVVPVTTTTTFTMLSAFSKFYNLQAVAIVSALYGTGFPIMLFILLPLFFFNIFNRLFVCLKLSSYQFGTPIPTDEELREGKRQLDKFKRIAERATQRSALTSMLNVIKVKDQGSFFTFFGGMSSPDSRNGRETTSVEEPSNVLPEPEPLSGEVERKGSSSWGASWKLVWAEVTKPGILYLFKDKKTAQSAFISARSLSPDESSAILENTAIEIVYLKMIKSFIIPEKGGGDQNNQLEIQIPGDSVKLRFKSGSDALHWKVLLQKWKDYAIDADDQGELKLDDDNNKKSSTGQTNSFDVKFSSTLKPGNNEYDRNMYDLDNITIEDDPEIIQRKPDKGFFSSFGFGVSSNDASKVTEINESSSAKDDKPSALKGWLEKKGRGTLGSEWQKRYCRVDEDTSSLTYSKQKEGDVTGRIDLRQVISVTINPKSGKDDFGRFDVDVGERVYKFKAKTKADADVWVNGLNEWRDYFLLHMNI